MNMGVLLLNFLQLYGQEFNYIKTALRIRSGGTYVCKEEMLAQMNRQSNSMLCIEDPLQPGKLISSERGVICKVMEREEIMVYLESGSGCTTEGNVWKGFCVSL